MPTLQEVLENDLGLGAEEPMKKVASQYKTVDDEIEKLAMELGMIDGDDTEKVAQTTGKTTGHKKEASMSIELEQMYSDLFPQDTDVISGTQEKVASKTQTQGLDKEAAAREERIGSMAYPYFEQYVDGHITKIAEELAGGATVKAEDGDGEPEQAMDNNRPEDSEDAIDTDPTVTDEVKAKNEAKTVGQFVQKQAGSRNLLKEAAMRKHMLLSHLDQ